MRAVFPTSGVPAVVVQETGSALLLAEEDGLELEGDLHLGRAQDTVLLAKGP